MACGSLASSSVRVEASRIWNGDQEGDSSTVVWSYIDIEVFLILLDTASGKFRPAEEQDARPVGVRIV